MERRCEVPNYNIDTYNSANIEHIKSRVYKQDPIDRKISTSQVAHIIKQDRIIDMLV